jgi:2-dehydro-3-deoxy-D-arabinonate dehydratase
MRIARARTPEGRTVAVAYRDGLIFPLQQQVSLADLLALPLDSIRERMARLGDPVRGYTLLKPIDRQEVWAAGVTYERSRDARIEESVSPDPYQRVYDAARPELFFKASAERVRGPGEPVAIRADSTWDVPEPELAVVCNSALEIVGYTIGNDVSSRSIEGENPLYLPQAKLYDGGCALGPWITPAWNFDPRGRRIELEVSRTGEACLSASTSTDAMRRSIPELVSYLGRDNRFPDGVVLLTGTGIVPPDSFTLAAGDEVAIRIDGLGELRNPVQRRGVQPS